MEATDTPFPPTPEHRPTDRSFVEGAVRYLARNGYRRRAIASAIQRQLDVDPNRAEQIVEQVLAA